MSEKPSQNESEFFAREEAEKLHRLHQEKLKSVEIDKCFRCGVILLDDGELEQLAGKEQPDGFLASFSTLFKKS